MKKFMLLAIIMSICLCHTGLVAQTDLGRETTIPQTTSDSGLVTQGTGIFTSSPAHGMAVAQRLPTPATDRVRKRSTETTESQPGLPRVTSPVEAERIKKLDEMPAELPAPVIVQVSPTEAMAGNVVITVKGQFFGGGDPVNLGRRIILTQKTGATQVIPAIDSWKTTEIKFNAPNISGIYELRVDNASSNPLSNAVDIMFGLKTKEVTVNFDPILGGTTLSSLKVPAFYVGHDIGTEITFGILPWRTVFPAYSPEYPQDLVGQRKFTVIREGWSEEKNSKYDIRIECYTRFVSSPAQVAFQEGNYLVIAIPHRVEIHQEGSIYWYNIARSYGYHIENPILSEPMAGMLTIRVPLSVVTVAGKTLILSSKAEVSWTGDVRVNNPWPDDPYLGEHLEESWVKARTYFSNAIAEKFGTDLRMSVFGNELTNHINDLVSGDPQFYRIETTGPQRIKVYYTN